MIDVSATDMKNMLSAASIFTKEATFKVEGDELIIHLLDPAHVAMLRATAKLNSIDEDITEFTVNIEQFQKALSISGDESKFEVDSGVLVISGKKAKVKLPLISTERTTLKMPEFDIIAEATIDPGLAKNVLQYGAFSKCDFMKVSITDGELKLWTGEYPHVAEVTAEEKGYGTASAGYPMDYALPIVETVSKAKCNLTIGLGGRWRPRDN